MNFHKLLYLLLITTLLNCSPERRHQSFDKSCSLTYPIIIDGKWGAIDDYGKVVIDVKYDWLYFNRLGNGLILAEKNPFKIILDSSGKILIDSIPYEIYVEIIPHGVRFVDKSDVDTLKIDDINKQGSCKFSNEENIDWAEILKDEIILGCSDQEHEIKRIGIANNGSLALYISKNDWGYVNSSGRIVWNEIIPNLPIYWSLMDVKNMNKEDKFEKRFEESIQAYDLVEYYLNYLISDLKGDQNIDFHFSEYQRGLIN